MDRFWRKCHRDSRNGSALIAATDVCYLSPGFSSAKQDSSCMELESHHFCDELALRFAFWESSKDMAVKEVQRARSPESDAPMFGSYKLAQFSRSHTFRGAGLMLSSPEH